MLWVGTLVNRLGGFVVPFLSLYLTRSRGMSIGDTGLIVSLYGLGLIGAGPLGGWVADRWGRKPAILIGLGAGGTCAIALGCSKRLEFIALFTFLLALLGEMYRPGVQAAVADLVPSKDRPRAYGLIYWAINLGFAIAVSAAGFFVERGYGVLFYIDGITSIAYAVLVLVAVPETRPPGVREATPGERSSLVAPLMDPVFGRFLLGTLFLVLVFWQHQVALPVDLTAHGVSPATYGRLIGINGFLIVVLQPFVAEFLGRRDRSNVLAIACLLVGLGFGMNALVTTTPLFGVAIAVWTLGEIAYFPLANALVADLAPTAQRGRYQGLFSMVGGVAGVVAPVTGGVLLQHAGRIAVWGVCLGLGILAAGTQLGLGRRLRARFKPAAHIDTEP